MSRDPKLKHPLIENVKDVCPLCGWPKSCGCHHPDSQKPSEGAKVEHTPGAMRAARAILSDSRGAAREAGANVIGEEPPERTVVLAARLISKETGDAELLSALEAALPLMKQQAAWDWEPIIEQAEAAIAKARGGAK